VGSLLEELKESTSLTLSFTINRHGSLEATVETVSLLTDLGYSHQELLEPLFCLHLHRRLSSPR